MLSDKHQMATSSNVLGPMKEKAHCPKVFVFVEGLCVRNEVKLSRWMVDSQEFRKID